MEAQAARPGLGPAQRTPGVAVAAPAAPGPGVAAARPTPRILPFAGPASPGALAGILSGLGLASQGVGLRLRARRKAAEPVGHGDALRPGADKRRAALAQNRRSRRRPRDTAPRPRQIAR